MQSYVGSGASRQSGDDILEQLRLEGLLRQTGFIASGKRWDVNGSKKAAFHLPRLHIDGCHTQSELEDLSLYARQASDDFRRALNISSGTEVDNAHERVRLRYRHAMIQQSEPATLPSMLNLCCTRSQGLKSNTRKKRVAKEPKTDNKPSKNNEAALKSNKKMQTIREFQKWEAAQQLYSCQGRHPWAHPWNKNIPMAAVLPCRRAADNERCHDDRIYTDQLLKDANPLSVRKEPPTSNKVLLKPIQPKCQGSMSSNRPSGKKDKPKKRRKNNRNAVSPNELTPWI